MTWNDHDHRSEYAEQGHDHYDYASEHHRHYDLENDDEKASRRITGLQDEVEGLRGQLADAIERIAALEKQTPQARQLQLEADQAAADLAESGYDRHGRDCQCPYCSTDEPEPEEYDPGPEADDEGGMSEYRYLLPEEYGRRQS
jgi:TolA-binding protein